jgi:hypothetical protein
LREYERVTRNVVKGERGNDYGSWIFNWIGRI